MVDTDSPGLCVTIEEWGVGGWGSFPSNNKDRVMALKCVFLSLLFSKLLKKVAEMRPLTVCYKI